VPAGLNASKDYGYCKKSGSLPVCAVLKCQSGSDRVKIWDTTAHVPPPLRYKSGRGGWIWRTWFRRSRARLDFGRAHYIGNRDFRANFEIGRALCRGRIDINFEFLRALLHCHHAARSGCHRPSDLISLRPGGDVIPLRIKFAPATKLSAIFIHAVNYEPPKARRKTLENIDLHTDQPRLSDLTL
jgi:hypothetical protein